MFIFSLNDYNIYINKGEEEEYTNGYPDNGSGRENEDAGQGKLQISYCISFDCVI